MSSQSVQIKWCEVFAEYLAYALSRLHLPHMQMRRQWTKPDKFIKLQRDMDVLRIQWMSLPEEREICRYDLIEHTNFVVDSDPLFMPYKFFTVSDFAIIYQKLVTQVLTDEQRRLIGIFERLIKELLDYDGLQTPVSKPADAVFDFPVIKAEWYPQYVDIQVALDGGTSGFQTDAPIIHTDKMIHLTMIPVIGRTDQSWIAPDHSTQDCSEQSEQMQAIGKFQTLLQSLKAHKEPNDLRVSHGHVIEQAVQSIRNPEYGLRLKRYVRVLLGETFDDIKTHGFGRYEPKNEEDELADLIPEMSVAVGNLPEAIDENFTQLIDLFCIWEEKKNRNKGHWEQGNQILGEKPKEYRPSYEEAVLSEIGDRIKRIVEKFDASNADAFKPFESSLRVVSYQRFIVSHMDVMGSGRYFTVEKIERIFVALLPAIQFDLVRLVNQWNAYIKSNNMDPLRTMTFSLENEIISNGVYHVRLTIHANTGGSVESDYVICHQVECHIKAWGRSRFVFSSNAQHEETMTIALSAQQKWMTVYDRINLFCRGHAFEITESC